MSATLGTIDVSIQYSGVDTQFPPFYIESNSGQYSLETNDYAANPLPDGTSLTSFGADNGWTINFSRPVDELLLYNFFWRSAPGHRGGAGGPSPVAYKFDHPFEIASGNHSATISGNTFYVPDSVDFQSGILRFVGPISELTLSTSATQSNYQGMTLAIRSAAVPEPVSIVSFTTGLLLIMCFRHKVRHVSQVVFKDRVHLAGHTEIKKYGSSGKCTNWFATRADSMLV